MFIEYRLFRGVCFIVVVEHWLFKGVAPWVFLEHWLFRMFLEHWLFRGVYFMGIVEPCSSKVFSYGCFLVLALRGVVIWVYLNLSPTRSCIEF